MAHDELHWLLGSELAALRVREAKLLQGITHALSQSDESLWMERAELRCRLGLHGAHVMSTEVECSVSSPRGSHGRSNAQHEPARLVGPANIWLTQVLTAMNHAQAALEHVAILDALCMRTEQRRGGAAVHEVSLLVDRLCQSLRLAQRALVQSPADVWWRLSPSTPAAKEGGTPGRSGSSDFAARFRVENTSLCLTVAPVIGRPDLQRTVAPQYLQLHETHEAHAQLPSLQLCQASLEQAITHAMRFREKLRSACLVNAHGLATALPRSGGAEPAETRAVVSSGADVQAVH